MKTYPSVIEEALNKTFFEPSLFNITDFFLLPGNPIKIDLTVKYKEKILSCEACLLV